MVKDDFFSSGQQNFNVKLAVLPCLALPVTSIRVFLPTFLPYSG
jgi:hypothetical protein